MPCVLLDFGSYHIREEKVIGSYQHRKVNNASSTSLYFVIKWLDLRMWRMGCKRLTSARLPAPSNNLPVGKLVLRWGCVPHKCGIYLVGCLGLDVMATGHIWLEAGALWDPKGSPLKSDMCNVSVRDLRRWPRPSGLQVVPNQGSPFNMFKEQGSCP